MATDNYPQSPSIALAIAANQAQNTDANQNANMQSPVAIGMFPNANEKARLDDYEYYRRLFLGKHFEAFRIRIEDERYNRAYSKLRYVVVNFAGLLSKIMADMLFSEPPTIKVPDGDQDWVDAFVRENHLDVQCYESALSNSALGDAVFKLRAGPRNKNDTDSTVIAEDITPRLYFPKIDGFNVRANPNRVELKWTFRYGDEMYLRVEAHESGRIFNHVYQMKGDQIIVEVAPANVGMDLKPEEITNLDALLVTHVPNWKTGDRHFGLSDYHDLDYLFYALNNRMSKIDNILDKHGDPILMVPPGIIKEDGTVNKKALGVIEVAEGETGKPEYIVWDASLDAAFKEVEKLVDFLYLTSEISPDLLGLGEGNSESGRALKFKLMRTLAKTARKRLYYDQALKELIYNAQVFAKANGLKVDGKTLKGEPVKPEIEWNDGLPIDDSELQTQLIEGIDAGIVSKQEAVMTLDGVDEKSADAKLAQIEKEKPKIELPTSTMGKDAEGMMNGKGGNGNDGGQK